MTENDGTAASYVCTIPNIYEDPTCPYQCVGLSSCQDCQCAVEQSGGGPWGKAMDVIMCLLPIVFLLVATLVPNPLPTTVSLPASALIMFLVRLMYLGSDPLLTSGSVIKGVHEALTPLSIMGGAIMLFETMEATLCMPYMMREMKALTNGHSVTELMFIFAFAYMVEGASGFGTPVALGAPMLVSMGHPKFECVVTLLLMNTFATVWGAAGTPIWFGFGNLGLTEGEFIEISYKAAVALCVATYILLPMVLLFLIPFKMIRENLVFVLLALSTTVIPSLGLSFASYEFPSLIGGMIGCCLTAVLIKFRVGLKPVQMVEDEEGRHPMDIGTVSDVSILVSFKNEQRKNSSKESKTIEQAADDFLEDIDEAAERREEQSNDKVESANGGDDKDAPSSPAVTADKSSQGTKMHQQTSPTMDSNSNEPDEESGERAEENTWGCEEGEMRESHRAIHDRLGPRKEFGDGYITELVGRTFPIWGTVLILVLTRIPQIGLKDLLTRTEPSFAIYFNTYGIFKCSASLVLQLQNILTYPQLNWKYELLYVPFLVPFMLVSFITIGIYRKQLQQPVRGVIGTVTGRLKSPAVALMGALTLVQLMITGGEASPANIIGTILSEAFKGGWIVIAALIGVLGSFFSGSTTISNLTFGEIQSIAAEQIGTSTTAMLALQAAGASAGNGVCLNNIIAACAVVGLVIGEGKIIAQTCKIVLSFALVATVVMLAAFFRF